MDDGKKEVGIPQWGNDRPSRAYLNIHVIPSVALKWKALGEVLLHCGIVETGYLEITETDNPKDVVECCRKMFRKWLETDKDASWEQLIIALQSPGVQLNFLAEEIKKKLQKDTELTDDVLKSMASKLSNINNAEWRTLGFYLNIDENIMDKMHKMPDKRTKSKVYTMMKIWRNNTPGVSPSQLKGIISKFKSNQSTSISSVSTLDEVYEMAPQKRKQGIDQIPQAPVIITHPPSHVQMMEGHTGILEVVAKGTMPLYYKWHFEGHIIAGETKSYIKIFPVTKRHVGRYYCQVKNRYGTVNSRRTTVTTSTTARPPSHQIQPPLSNVENEGDEMVSRKRKQDETEHDPPASKRSAERRILKNATLDELIIMHGRLLNDLEDEFKRSGESIQRIRENLIYADVNKLSLLSHPVIKTITSIHNMFTVIRKTYRFYDFSVLKILVRLSNCSKAQKLINDYEEEVNDLLIQDLDLKPLLETEEYMHSGNSNKLEISCEMETMSARQYNFITDTLKTIGLPSGSVLLKDVKQGSLIIVYEISPRLKDYLLNLSITAHMLKPLADLKIRGLIINDEMELKIPNDCDTEKVVSWNECNRKIITDSIKETISTKSDSLTSSDDDNVHAKVKKDRPITENFDAHFSYIDPSSVLTVFFKVTDSVVELLKSCHVELLIDVCENLMASDKYPIKFFSDCQMKRLQTFDSSFLLLQKLRLLFTWSNHSILRVLADQCSEAVKILDNFDCRVNSFELIASYHIPFFSLNMVPIDTSTHTILAIRCGQELYKSTLQYVYDMQSVMMDKCDITQHCLQLLAIRSNPTILYWTIPKCIVYLINTTVPLHSEYLYSRGILGVWVYPELQLTFGGHVSVGSLAFDDPKLVETKYGVQENENSKFLQEHVENLKADKIMLKEQLEDLNEKLQTEQILHKANKQLPEKMTDIKFKNAQLKDQIDQLKDQKDQLKDQNDQLKDQNNQLKDQNDQIKDQNDQLKSEVQEITEKMAELKDFELQSIHYDDVQEVHKYNESLQEFVKQLEADKITLEEQLEDLNTKLKTEELQMLCKTNEQLHEELTHIKLENAQLNNQKDQLKLELQEITKKMAEFNEPKQLQSIDNKQNEALSESDNNDNTMFCTDISHNTPQQAPVITSHPQDVQVQEGHQVILEVKAYGTAPLHYQWYHKFKTILGENKSFYCIYPATMSNSGHYYCKVENQYGAKKSRSAIVTVITLPTATDSATDSAVANLVSKMQIQDATLSADVKSKLPVFAQDNMGFDSVEATFSSFVDDMFNILKQEDFSEVKRKSLENLNVAPGIPLAGDIENAIDESKNLSDLFITLSGHCRPYWNWMNIRMLEKMAGNSSAAKETIQKYKNNIYSRKVKDVMSDISNLEVPTNGYTEVNLKEKWEIDFDGLTINDVVQQRNEIETKFNVEDTMLLKSIISDDEVCWLLPNHLVEQVSCSVTNNQQGRPDDDQSGSGTQELFPEVLYLKIGDRVIKNDINEYLHKATDALVKYYKSEETVPLEYDWPTCCVEHYTPLTIFCYKVNYTKSEATAVARMLTSIEHHDNVYGKITENISDLFAPFEEFSCSPFVILIEGAAGIGKSTLCKEIALEWTNKKVLKNRSLLFLLLMHDPKIKNLKNVELLVKYFIKSENLASKIVEWLKETDGKYLTIVIDGYSEDSQNSFITDDIIRRKILTQCGLVITSRSAASSHLPEIINQRAFILGFNKSNQVSFIDTALRDSHSKLKDYLHSNPLIDNLCNIPLIMTILIWFVVNNEEISYLTQTSLIQKYIMTFIKKNIIPSRTSNLHHKYDQVIKDLSQFAFIAIQEDQLTFTMGETLKLGEKHFQVYWEGPDFLARMLKLGLLSTISFQEENVDCEMLHFSNLKVQEYLAAYYISSLPDNELLKLLHGTFWNICYLNVWMLYVDIIEGKSSVFKHFLSNETSNVSVKTASGDHDNRLLVLDIDLNHQKLSHDHTRVLAMLLSKLPNRQWRNLNLASCDIDSQGCTVLCEMLCLNMEIKFETVDMSYNNFHWESFYTICSMLKAWYTTKFVFSIDTLYDTVTMIVINKFTAMLEENFQNDESSNNVLLLTYVAKQSKLTAVYLAPTCIRWFHWNDRKLNEDTIKCIKVFIENKVGNNKFKLAFSYTIIDHHENLPTLLSGIKDIQLCGSYLHSKGAYLLNIASTIDYQYNLPQELVADYLAAVLSQNTQSTTPYLESLPVAHATMVENSLKNELSMSVFDISNNSINNQIMTEIDIILHFTSNLQKFYASDNNLLAEGAIMIAKSLKNFLTLTVFNISNNSICEKAADDIAVVLSHSTQLQELYLNNNNLKTAGMITIAKAIKNISTLTVFNIDNNKVGEEAADDIATVLSSNATLQGLILDNNSFGTAGMIKIAMALQSISTLKLFSIDNNKVGEEAADDIATVLSKNATLQRLILDNNCFGTGGMIKIAKALKYISTLTLFSIDNNNVGEEAKDTIVEEAAEIIAEVLSNNTKLQKLVLSNNSFKTLSIIIIARALPSSLTCFSIANNGVGENAGENVAMAFSQNTKLEQLYLNNNNFWTEGMKTIAKGLQHISTLTTLNICSNKVGKEAADDIATVLSRNNNLQELYLDNNHFETSSMNKFAEALQTTSTLLVLSFNHNYVGDGAADNIAKVISRNSRLQKLCLSKNVFKVAGMIKIAKALQTITTLAVLNISKNNVGEEMADDIAAVVKCNANLKALDLHDNNLKTSGIIKIAEALQNTSTLTVFNISNNNVTEEAADCVSAALFYNTQLQELYLDNNSFNTISIIKIANVLQTFSTLTVFNISNNNVDKEVTDDIAAVLLHNTQLQQLYLDNNNLMTSGMIKIANALQNTFTLTVFDVGNNSIGKEAADTIATVLSRNTQLKLLNLNNNNFMTEGMIKIAMALKNTSNLTVFSIINNGVDDRAAGDIATVLSHNTKLQRLDFGYNSFKSVGMMRIANALQNISTLTTIAINNNAVGDKAANDIAAVLSHNPKLQGLDFGWNSFKSSGMIRIAKALISTRITTLTIFAINNNGVDEKAADDLAEVLFHNTQLQGLDFSNNNFKSAGMIKIAKALRIISTLVVFSISNNNVGEEAADDIATVLSHNTSLQKLYLNDNNFKAEGMIRIAKGLQNTSTLRILNISNNNVGEEAADNIAAVLSHNTQLQQLYLQNNNLKMAGAIKITGALKNTLTLAIYNISGNNIKRAAIQDFVNILSWNTKLKFTI